MAALTEKGIVLPEYAVAGVNYADGLSRAEAELVAADYFRRFVGSCGRPDKPRDRGAFWCVRFWGGMLARDEGQLWVAKDGSRILLQPPSKGLPSATKVLLQRQGIAYE